MKLLVAIVNNNDAHTVSSNLSKAGFFITKISSTGGFLMNGNTTFLMGINNEDIDHAIDIIRRYSQKHVQPVPSDARYTAQGIPSFPTEVTVGGATVFVMNIEKFEQV